MEARLKVEKPEEIRFTMTITMSAGAWEKLREQLYSAGPSVSYPVFTLRQHIDNLLAQARKVFWSSEASGEEGE